MMTAGLTLMKSLDILYKQQENKDTKACWQAIYEDVQKGQSFSEALKAQSGVFPEFFISIFLENSRIYAQASGQSRAEIFPEKEDLFFLKVVKAQIRFVRNDKKEVTSMVLIQNGQEMPGKKVQ